MLYFLKTRPAFVFLLCIFFVWHGYTVNFDFIPLPGTLMLAALYITVALITTLLFRLFFRNTVKAALVVFSILFFHFFFGAAHDTVKKIFEGFFITRYSFILPASFIFFLLLVIILKKTRKPLFRITYFLNVLFLLLILFDCVWLAVKIINPGNNTGKISREFRPAGDYPKPDIYLIVADEYAGNTELKDIFGFDNTSFTDSLKQIGFHTVPYSRSNYNYTPFAAAALLNMDYLTLQNRNRSQSDIALSYSVIRDSRLLRFLEYNGYRFYNYSVFDFRGQPARTQETFLPVKTKLITAQTFLSRLNRDIRFNLITRWNSRSELKRLTYSALHNNNHIYQLTWNNAEIKTTGPKFVYSHLMMPHYPYYFDENGRPLPFERLVEGNQVNRTDYISYLKYCNRKFLDLLHHILQCSSQPPMIILMGDHGFRHFKEPVANDYHFLNFLSVLLPGKNYSSFPDSLTSVNLFRHILNTGYGQSLPLLADSTIYLRD